MIFGNTSPFEWTDPLTCDPIRHWLLETAPEIDCTCDCIPAPDEDLIGLTVLDHPHITAAGSIVELRNIQ